MVCKRCRERQPDPRGPGDALFDMPESDRLAQVLCTRCGAPLPPGEQTDALLRRFSSLARFGLAGGTSPLLGG